MERSLDLMVFTDLDGTLLDHETYRWDAAEEALCALRRAGGALVLASSKTAAEIAPLRAALSADRWPAIVENGAGLLPPGAQSLPDPAPYHALRATLAALPAPLRASFTGFGDLSAAQIAQITGLSPEAASLAQRRAFSEPGLWRGTDTDRTLFLEHLRAAGVQAQQGGRFLTLSHGGNKADRVRALIQAHSPTHSIALGDAPNDIDMLHAADQGVIVANPHTRPLPPQPGEARGHISRTELPGPQGWNAAILSWLAQLNL